MLKAVCTSTVGKIHTIKRVYHYVLLRLVFQCFFPGELDIIMYCPPAKPEDVGNPLAKVS
jgi:hypothetical protein